MLAWDSGVVEDRMNILFRFDNDFCVLIDARIHCEDAYRMEELADILRIDAGSRRAQRDISWRRCSSLCETVLLSWSYGKARPRCRLC
jgi:hypothetical protein